MTTLATRTLSISIERPFAEVYDFVCNPTNLPQWARGLCLSVSQIDEAWMVETPAGAMRLRFVERNHFGVADHYVETPEGATVYVPMRVLPNGSGSEILFTLLRLPGMSDADYEADANMIERDLTELKAILERVQTLDSPQTRLK